MTELVVALLDKWLKALGCGKQKSEMSKK